MDLSILAYIFAQRDPTALAFFLHVTQLGSVVAILFITLAIILILALHQRLAETIGLIVAVGGTAVSARALKTLIERPRPDAMYQAYLETGYALPSEHTALSTALCAFLVYLVFRIAPSQGARTVAVCAAVLIVAEVGFSRMYLGVHYASDVAAGFALGIIMAGIGILIECAIERITSRPQRVRAR